MIDNVPRREKGILYIATGKKFVEATIKSAISVKEFCPGLDIHFFIDQENYDKLRQNQNLFSSIGIIDSPHYRSKVDYLSKSPFEKTLYLDSDTKVCNSVYEIFDLLDRFDIALAHAHRRNSDKTLAKWNKDIPYSFPQFNGGVIAYKSTKVVLDFLESWKTAFYEASLEKDQVTLRELLWDSKLRIATLPPEYNIRYSKYLKVWNKYEAIPKILHFKEYLEEESNNLIWNYIKKFFKSVSG